MKGNGGYVGKVGRCNGNKEEEVDLSEKFISAMEMSNNYHVATYIPTYIRRFILR